MLFSLPQRGQYILQAQWTLDLTDVYEAMYKADTSPADFYDAELKYAEDSGLRRVGEFALELPEFLVLTLDMVRLSRQKDFAKWIISRRYNEDNKVEGSIMTSSYWNKYAPLTFLPKDDALLLAKNKIKYLKERHLT